MLWPGKLKWSDTAFESFACLVCRANVSRPWYDFDAKQYIGFDTEIRYGFLLDLQYWNWKTALSNEMPFKMPLHSSGELSYTLYPTFRNLGRYLASPGTWSAKWIDILLQPTNVFRADEAKYFIWRWYRHYLIDKWAGNLWDPRMRYILNFEEYLEDPESAWRHASHPYYEAEAATEMDDEESEEEDTPASEH